MKSRYAVTLVFDQHVSAAYAVARFVRSRSTLEAARRLVTKTNSHGFWTGRGVRRQFYPASRLLRAHIDPR